MSEAKKKKSAVRTELTIGSCFLFIGFPCIVAGVIGATFGLINSMAGGRYTVEIR